MEQKLSIKCPHCSTTLFLTMKDGVDPRKSKITCPMCKRPSLLSDCKPANPPQPKGPMHSGLDGGTIIPGQDTQTLMQAQGFYNKVGHLRVVAPNNLIALNPNPMMLNQGSNIIGRKSQSIKVECPVDVGTPRSRFSRQHLVLEVRQIQGRVIHSLRLYKREVNDTFVNNAKIQFGDSVVLNNGDILHLPDCDLLFEV